MAKKNQNASGAIVSKIPLPASDTPLVIDLPDGQKIVIGKMSRGSIVEVATWRGTGRPDSRTNRLILGVGSTQAEGDAPAPAVGRWAPRPSRPRHRRPRSAGRRRRSWSRGCPAPPAPSRRRRAPAAAATERVPALRVRRCRGRSGRPAGPRPGPGRSTALIHP